MKESAKYIPGKPGRVQKTFFVKSRRQKVFPNALIPTYAGDNINKGPRCGADSWDFVCRDVEKRKGNNRSMGWPTYIQFFPIYLFSEYFSIMIVPPEVVDLTDTSCQSSPSFEACPFFVSQIAYDLMYFCVSMLLFFVLTKFFPLSTYDHPVSFKLVV